ncbi:hypothetical protein C9I57_12390 [Trinickia symbiotica]|uniref:Uncharacterized protein n=1 Tax=Trinickia symbiotica TaxID=863227 RepID=A0A2T3XVU4_9BURK|nr:hypothetical protein [Trinickia symbiotica]PTB20621.1 hypothetical protein C9I57_12390 [Trinickia symbiotica]
MAAYRASVIALAKRPSAFIPILTSLAAFALTMGTIAVAGPVRESDEGAIAHIYQLLVVGELPVLGFFILKWLRRDVRAALTVLAIQGAVLGLAMFPAWYFGL